MSPTPRQMGKRIQALRKKLNLSRQQLAERADVSREYIRKLEAGGYDPTVGTLQRIAKALGVSLAELIG
jgi:transcriptional regulator with XRE-family HTH domain